MMWRLNGLNGLMSGLIRNDITLNRRRWIWLVCVSVYESVYVYVSVCEMKFGKREKF